MRTLILARVAGDALIAQSASNDAALYTIGAYTSKYGHDERVTQLLDNFTLYVLPRITVDGSETFLTTPHWLRSSMRMSACAAAGISVAPASSSPVR